MQIPKKVRIGGIEYAVRFTKNPNVGSDVCYGTFNSEECFIELNDSRNLTHERLCETLLHEILHGVWNQATLDDESEEQIINPLAKGLFAVIQDNPAIFERPPKK